MAANPITKVLLSSEVYLICMTQSLSTEVEEIMGLVIGYFDDENGLCVITNCMQLKRLDKRKDRVEIGYDQMIEGTRYAERLSGEQIDKQRELHVVGWYHSHPHITVFPSDVDVRTQMTFEAMDSRWIGLIFGVFNTDKQGQGRCPIIAFQSNKNYDDEIAVAFAGCDLSEKSSKKDNTPDRHSLIPISAWVPSELVQPALTSVALESLVSVAKQVAEEISDSYNRLGKVQHMDTVRGLHNNSVFSQSVCKLVSGLALPLAEALRVRKEVQDQTAAVNGEVAAMDVDQ